MIGIIVSPDRKKEKILAALKEENVNYYFIDIFKDNWKYEVKKGTQGFLLYPPAYGAMWKITFNRRLKYLIDKYNVVVSPSLNAVEIYESKTAMYDFMEINNIAHPKTSIYFNYTDIKENLSTTNFPVIIKADGGSGASNIKVITNPLQYKNIINRVFLFNYKYKNVLDIKRSFTKFIYRYVSFSRNKNGYMIPKDELFSSYIIQQDIIDVKFEWRVIFINDSYFIHGKGQNDNGFHSGSKKKIWDFEDFKVLNFAKNIIEKHNLYDINIDIFEDGNGDLFVNEIQCIFGTSLEYQMKLDGKAGRYIYDDEWIFEEGDFTRNGCNNMRIQSIFNKIDRR